MGACSLDGDTAGMAKAASDLYPKAMSGDTDAQLNLLDVVSGINNNNDCMGHDEYVKGIKSQLSGQLANDAILTTGERPGYPRLEETKSVAELHIPSFESLLKSQQR
jgi:hypothetical protein